MKTIEWKGQSRCKYKGILTQQNPNVFNVFKDFLGKESFDYIIEIGTSYGGLSLFLYEQSLVYNSKFISYDWLDFKKSKWSNRTDKLKKLFSGKIPFDFRNKNVFEKSTIKEISNILSNNKCLLLCDGGDKPEEFRIYSKYLTKNSYIMAHDYAKDKKHFNEKISKNVWGWFEIQDSDIQPSIDKEKLTKSDYYNSFENIAWVQCIKK